RSRRPLAWQLGLARLVRGLWTYPIPAYLRSSLILNKQGEKIELDVGFALKRRKLFFCTCERGLILPVSTYIPYRRPRSGRIMPLFEDPNAEMPDDDLMIMVDGAAPKETKAVSGPGEPDDAELGADADEQELDELDEYLI